MGLKILQDTPPWDWPRDTAEKLREVLRDKQAPESERLIAADLSGDFVVINDKLAEALLVVVGNDQGSEDLRGRAAIALGPVLEQAYLDDFEDPEDVPISEQTYHNIRETLHSLFMNPSIPKEVRRRILEAAVRSPQDWHSEAIRTAYSSDDESWNITAVFCMRFVPGFNDRILEALESKNKNIYYEAVCAAGNWELEAAWPYIAKILTSKKTSKSLVLAAIDAAGGFRSAEAAMLLGNLMDSRDEEIAEAAYEAMAMIEALLDEDSPA